MPINQKKCPVCASNDVLVFIEIPEVPVFCNVLWPSREEAQGAPKGDITLGFCTDCGHIFNTGFDPGHVHYNSDYENSLHYSTIFQDYARGLAERLIAHYGLYGKEIVEIGCGNGEFLRLFNELGGNRCVGFDSACNTKSGSGEADLIFIKDHYSEKYSAYKGDFFCCRQVLEHVSEPRIFLEGLRSSIGDNLNTVVFFEVPNILHTLKDNGVWDVIYEHYSYFSPLSLRRLFESCGFRVINQMKCFRDQFIGIEASPDHSPAGASADKKELATLSRDVAAFTAKYTGNVLKWSYKLKVLKAERRKTVVWGAGSKGVTFLNTLKVKDEIASVVDINPNKQGKFIPLSAHEVVNPQRLAEIRPDVIIVMNPAYLDEIAKMAAGLGLRSRILKA